MPFKRLDRRTFLRSAGVAIGLPFLDAMLPAGAAEAEAREPIKRMVLIGRSSACTLPIFSRKDGEGLRAEPLPEDPATASASTSRCFRACHTSMPIPTSPKSD